MTDERIGSGSVMGFDVPPGVTGTVHLTVSVPFLYTLQTVPPAVVPNEALTYSFDLTVQPARTVTVNQAVQVDGHSVTLRWLRFSATAVRLRLDADLSGLVTDAHPTWMLDASVQRPDGSTEHLSSMALPPGWKGQPKTEIQDIIDGMNGSVTIYQAMSGTDNPTGTWTVTVHHLIGFDGKGGTIEVKGPWVFRVKVP